MMGSRTVGFEVVGTRPAEVVETPWDRAVFGLPTFEIKEPTEAALAFAQSVHGHFTLKVNPLVKTDALHAAGFYYCDTLIEPYANRSMLISHSDDRVQVTSVSLEALEPLCKNSFQHGRYHRDPWIDNDLADQRYINWLVDIENDGNIFGLTVDDRLAAFFACRGASILLHVVAEEFRGKGLAKYLWSTGCNALLAEGHSEIHSSVSAANLAVVNLYASLGFRFRHATDIYHRLTR